MKHFILICLFFIVTVGYSDTTPNFAMEYMAQNELQPYVTVNTMMTIVDAFMQPTIKTYPADASPTINDPTNGDMFIVPANGEGDWDGQDEKLALYVNDDWTFFTPKAGWSVHSANAIFGITSIKIIYDGYDWFPEDPVVSLSMSGASITAAIELLSSGIAPSVVLYKASIQFGPDVVEAPVPWSAGQSFLYVKNGDLVFTAKYGGVVKSVTVVDFSEAP